LGHACYRIGDQLGEVHAFIERAQHSDITFHDLSNTASRLNGYLREPGIDVNKEQKRYLASRMLSVLKERRNEANADDLSRMVWLALHCGEEEQAREFVLAGLKEDPRNLHIAKLAQRLGIISPESTS